MRRSDAEIHGGLPREILTPEGVPLRLVLASGGDRAVAFAVDSVILGLALLVIAVLAPLAVIGPPGGGFTGAFALLVWFLLRNFYFTWFEHRWQGSTPGKRWAGLRVVDRHGGPLRADAVIVRNLTREIEVFLPLTVLLIPDHLWPGAPGWARALSILWLLILAFLPLFNRDRLRVGDLVAGTIVVLAPKVRLLGDLARERTAPGAGPPAHVFTPAQLDVYGIYELQVLEELLRGPAGPEGRRAREVVCGKIRARIGYDPALWRDDPPGFLQDFYAALRARLEHKMLFGRRRRDKFSKEA